MQQNGHEMKWGGFQGSDDCSGMERMPREKIKESHGGKLGDLMSHYALEFVLSSQFNCKNR